MARVIQPSFSTGEVSPTLYGRVDLAKYKTGLARCRNFFVDYRGGASNRPGTRFVGRCKSSSSKVRLIPFSFNAQQTYVLEFGDLYMRVIQAGGYVLEAAKNITAATQANPCQITSNAHGFSNGDWVYISGVGGMTQLNGNSYIVAGATANTFTLTDLNGNAVNSSLYTAYTSGGTVARYYTVVSPYAAADLALLKYTQSADTMTITHPSYQPRDLTRTGATSWTFTTISFGASIGAPTISAVTPSAAGTTGVGFVVTAVDANGQESVGSTMVANNACVNYTTTAGYAQVSWGAVAGASYYNVYRTTIANAASVPTGANVGYVGTAYGTSFIDGNIVPDFTKCPPQHYDPFSAGSNWPSTVAYFQQRKWFAAPNAAPETLYATKPGAFKNMDYAIPTTASDSLNLTLASQQVNNIKFMVPMPGGLVVLTGGGAWQISGGQQNAAVTPSNAVATAQAYNGCADLPPIVVNYDILYVQAKGSIVRDLAYNFFVNVYTGTDLTVLSNHLFNPHSLTEWTWAEEPFKLVWAVRDDGTLLSCTYLKEQEVLGWARHDSQGLYQSVTSIQEGQEDAVYFVVKRYVQGQWVQYVERMASRIFPNEDDASGPTIVENSWFVDCGLDYPLTYPSATLSLNAATGTAIATADSAVFAPEDVGKVLRAGGGIGTVASYISGTQVTVTWSSDVTAVIDDDSSNTPLPVANGAWSLTAPVTTVSGLSHLEGKTVKVLGDGSTFPDKVVTNGSITLDSPCSRIIVGLGYQSQLQTLDLEVEGTGGTVQGKRKKLSELTIKVQNTRGIKYGPTFDHIDEVKQRGPSVPMGTPIPLLTGQFVVYMDPSWNEQGRICIQQDYPLPATILAVAPDVEIGDNAK